MLFTLYNIYVRISDWDETFDEFLFWGELLLNDFDDVDKYMADARMLFTNVTDLKEIETAYGDLSETQVAAIRSFWASFNPKSSSPNQQSFRSVWKVLYQLYQEFKAALAAEGKGYEGMIFREVVENLQQEGWNGQLPYRKLVFVGLNALSLVEEKLLSFLKNKGLADFYWDYASDWVKDPDNKASFFAKQNMERYPSSLPLQEEGGKSFPETDVIGIPSAIGQAKQVYSLLEEISGGGQLSDEDSLRTAIVLPDERLLVPVLNAIPESVRSINVTMGYPLAGTPIASLMDFIPLLQKNVRYVDGLPAFYFRDVLPLLNHRYITGTNPEVVTALAQEIVRNKKILVGAGQLQQTPFLSTLFTPVDDVERVSDYLLDILSGLTSKSAGMEQEFVFHYYTTINRMKEVMQESGVKMTLQTYFRLLKRLAGSITIPFRGEPLSGLQVMGVLETRALDFDRLIILSMNEGIFPQKKGASSFIPYNLRRGFGLPTYEHQDSVWAYHFYRLIYRAKKLTLIYDSRNNGLQTGEMSRFIHQLHYHYGLPLHKKLVVYNVSSSKKKTIEMPKSEEAMKRLEEFRSEGGKAISASAINTWLDCPLRFYFSVIEGITEEEELTETVESNEFGSILHKVMEELYEPLCGRLVTADLLKNIRKDTKLVRETINRAFAGIHFHTGTVRPLAGQDFLTGEMIRKYVEKILEIDAKTLTPFHYTSSEKRMLDSITLPDGSSVRLKGFIDRIDDTGSAVRIVDYKSGSGHSAFHSVESLFDMEEKDRPKAVMQVFMYAWMYSRLPESEGKRLRPAVYYMRTLFSESFDPSIYFRRDKNKKEPVDDFLAYSAPFEEALRTCLAQIFSPEIPFIQSPTGKACAWCKFTDLCK
ncbi:hypothetical protein FACS1894181_08790 [Bacteroidia bacterium]|nr:hypothetical protein FACS1894181_08790 [Bacteroidia bacterium]